MTRSGWALLLGGIVAGTLVAAGIEALQKSRLADIEAQLSVVDKRLRELAPVKIRADAYHAQQARFQAQVEAIQQERERQRCPGLLLLDLELQAKPEVEAIALEGASLTVVGRAESDADAAAFAAGVRGASWARSVHEGRARQGSAPGALRFALMATVEQPRCRAPETPEPVPSTGR